MKNSTILASAVALHLICLAMALTDNGEIHRWVSDCREFRSALETAGKRPLPTVVVVTDRIDCSSFPWTDQIILSENMLIIGLNGGVDYTGVDFGDKQNIIGLAGAKVIMHGIQIIQDRLGSSFFELGFIDGQGNGSLRFINVAIRARSCSLGLEDYIDIFGGENNHMVDARPTGDRERDRDRYLLLELSQLQSDGHTGEGVSLSICESIIQCGNTIEENIFPMPAWTERHTGTCETEPSAPFSSMTKRDHLIHAPQARTASIAKSAKREEGNRTIPTLAIMVAGVGCGLLVVMAIVGFFVFQFTKRRRAPSTRRKSRFKCKEVAYNPGSTCDILSSRLEMLDLQEIEIGSPLGRGGFGKVYKGHFEEETFAVKVIEHDGTLLRASGEPMEALLCRNVDHPNVVKTFLNQTRSRTSVHSSLSSMPTTLPSTLQSTLHVTAAPQKQSGSFKSSSSADDFSYMAKKLKSGNGENLYRTWIVMEYCDRGSMDKALRDGVFFEDAYRARPNAKFVLTTLYDIAMAMNCLHSQKIIHGDLKPQNVLLKSTTADERGFFCKIGDFGLSRVIANNTHIETFTCGTVSHMPPELLKEGILTPAADVYSFGILAWELVTGSKPYPMKRHDDIIMFVCEGHRPQIPPHCPLPIASLIMDCWQDYYMRRPSFRRIAARLREMITQLSPAWVIPGRLAITEEDCEIEEIMESGNMGLTRQAPASPLPIVTRWMDRDHTGNGCAPQWRSMVPTLSENLLATMHGGQRNPLWSTEQDFQMTASELQSNPGAFQNPIPQRPCSDQARGQAARHQGFEQTTIKRIAVTTRPPSSSGSEGGAFMETWSDWSTKESGDHHFEATNSLSFSRVSSCDFGVRIGSMVAANVKKPWHTEPWRPSFKTYRTAHSSSPGFSIGASSTSEHSGACSGPSSRATLFETCTASLAGLAEECADHTTLQMNEDQTGGAVATHSHETDFASARSRAAHSAPVESTNKDVKEDNANSNEGDT